MPAMDIRNVTKLFLLYLGLLSAPGVALHWIGTIRFDFLPLSFSSRVFWLVIVLGLMWAVYDARVRLADVVKANPLYWLLLVFAVMSVFWSAAPLVSLKDLAALASMFLIGVALARVVTPVAGFSLLQVALVTLVVGSVLVAWYVPEIGTHSRWQGAPWKGLFWQKNGLGNAATLWGVLCLAMAVSARGLAGVLTALVGVVVAVLVMWKSDSVTSYFGFAAGVGVLLVLFGIQRGWFKAWHLAVVAVLALLFVTLFYGELFKLFGRNETLTGRWSMWQTLWPIMLDRPLFGYGYDAYTHADGVVERLGGWKNMLTGGGHPHNGLIKVQLDVGVGGVILVLGMMVHLSARVVGWAKRRAFDRPRYIAAGMWTVIFLHQIAEPSMFMPVSLSVVLLVYTSLISYSPSEPRPA